MKFFRTLFSKDGHIILWKIFEKTTSLKHKGRTPVKPTCRHYISKEQIPLLCIKNTGRIHTRQQAFPIVRQRPSLRHKNTARQKYGKTNPHTPLYISIHRASIEKCKAGVQPMPFSVPHFRSILGLRRAAFYGASRERDKK